MSKLKSIKALLAAGALLAIPASANAQDVVLQWQATALGEAQYEPIWRQMVAAFEAANPGIRIEPILVPRADNWTKFVTAAQARQAPCVVSVPVPTAAFNGYLMPLDEMWDAESEDYRNVWSQSAIEGLRFEGELYGLPFYAGIYGEVYNRALVEAAGLDPENIPTTWDEYFVWAKALTKNDQWATTVLAGPTDTTTRVLLSWIYSNGGRAFNEDLTEATFASDPKSLEAIEKYISLFTDGYAAPAPATLNYNEQTILFAQQRIATMRNAYWGLAKVRGDNPDLAKDMIVAAPPANDPDARTVATITAMSISGNCEHPEEAWSFIKFMNEPEWTVQMVTAANWMPLRNDLLDMPEVADDPIIQSFLEMGQTALTIPLSTPAWEQIASRDVVEAMQRALQEPARTKEIFTELDTVVTQRLNDL
ncbi:sugar ABC transporter substrate-binding protein [Aureimonas fodinaquatilis]|uniref:Sugar ABC transporter substrate-binding protein n=1 Tax=Aureimonas fodinaquatilis TaxID=2565783 RepID=A0A5B0DUZ3_9HYPH|nr:sugar ABC transporter substrate-binding protein [Aureimonas fodinaquatilis]KAA0969019.1 sugar ABC transporter substrate-binding protein [Aureimonas fodinaquatilis]